MFKSQIKTTNTTEAENFRDEWWQCAPNKFHQQKNQQLRGARKAFLASK